MANLKKPNKAHYKVHRVYLIVKQVSEKVSSEREDLYVFT